MQLIEKQSKNEKIHKNMSRTNINWVFDSHNNYLCV